MELSDPWAKLLLKEQMTSERTYEQARMQFVESLGEVPVVVQSGIGKVNAAACTVPFAVTHVINTGIGAFKP